MFLHRKIFSIFFGILFFPAFLCAETFQGSVVGVTDGDTLKVMKEGRAEVIRLYGIDAPEKSQDFGQKAKATLSDLVFQKIVIVRENGNDRYHRTIGTVLLEDGKNVNEEMVSKGFAWWYQKYAPKETHLKELQENAQKNKLGLWAHPSPTPPWDFRKHPKTASIEGTHNESVRGNLSSHIYHWKSCPGYEKIAPKNRKEFPSREEAERVRNDFNFLHECRNRRSLRT